LSDSLDLEISPQRPRFPLLRAVVLDAAALLAIATVAGWLGRFWWVADLSSHFTVYYTVGSAVVLLLAVVLRRWRTAVVLLIVLSLNAWSIYPTFFGGGGAVDAKGPLLRLAQVNLLHKNRDRERAIDFISHCEADIMIVQEVDPWWERVISEADTPYRFEVSRPRDGSFGIALLSRESLAGDQRIVVESTRVIDFANGFAGAERPAVEATLLLDGRRVKLLSIHPPPPVSAGLTALRDSILRQAKEWAGAQTAPHIIIGDLNTTPWSYAFSILTGDGQLVSTLDGLGNQGTWPTGLPLPWKLPIDHCLLSEGLICIDRRIGTEIGSDHLPLMMELMLSPAVGGVEAESGGGLDSPTD
jgi:endonuclease/exonuclease/phosphatase (EEP) superfamily protein YafD